VLHRYSPARGCQNVAHRTTAFPVDKAASARRGSARHRGRFKDLVVHVGLSVTDSSFVPVEAAGETVRDRRHPPRSRQSAELAESPTPSGKRNASVRSVLIYVVSIARKMAGARPWISLRVIVSRSDLSPGN